LAPTAPQTRGKIMITPTADNGGIVSGIDCLNFDDVCNCFGADDLKCFEVFAKA